MRLVWFFLGFTFFAYPKQNEYFEREEFKGAQIGIYIEELKRERPVYSYNEDLLFIPSSLQKIPTTIAALSLFGKDYHFSTKLEYEGNIDQGILNGNIWIRGGGDPTLGLDIIDTWVADLKSAGINHINGQIVLDPTCFETALASPQWFFEDIANYYGSGACGLTINQNMYYMTFKPANKEGLCATLINTSPVIQNISYFNEVKTGPAGSGDQVFVFGSEYSNLQYLRGTIPLDSPTFTIKAAIPDPVAFLGDELMKRLKPEKGVRILREKEKAVATRIVKEYLSPPLKDIVIEMNRTSNNLYAEHLFKLVGDGTGAGGKRHIQQLLTNWGVVSQVMDGAGPARTNLITPKGFVTILKKIKSSPYFDLVYTSLPQPGEKGSLAFFPFLTNGKLRAKTGSMRNIYNLGGYLNANNGKEYAFAIFCNHHLANKKQVEKQIQKLLETVIENEID